MKQPEDRIYTKIMKLVRFVLLKIIKPDIIVNKVSDLDVEAIKRIKEEYGIKAIILDVDKTLRENMKKIPQVNKDWIESIKASGVKIIILSNGLDNSIEQYFASKGIDYIGFACKPFKRNFLKACERLKVNPKNIIVVGNSLLIDVLGGNRNRMRTVLVREVVRE